MRYLAVALAGCICLGAAREAHAQKPAPKPLSVAEAVRLLRDNDAMYRSAEKRRAVVAAFQAVPAGQRPQAVAQLLPLVGQVPGRGAGVLRQSFLALGDAGIAPLADLLKDAQRWRGVLDVLPFYRERALPVLLPLLESKDDALRIRGALALERTIGPPARLGNTDRSLAALPALTNALRDASPEVAVAAARALAAMGRRAKESVGALADALKAPRADLRAAAARALERIGAEAADAAPALTAALSDKAPAVRRAAAGALGAIGPQAVGSLRALGMLLRDENLSVAVRAEVAAAMGQVGAGRAEEAVALLMEGCRSREDAVCIHAARSAAGIGAAAAKPLEAALKDRSPRTRRFAAFALAKIGPAAKGSAPALEAVLRDRDPLVRRNAAEALGRIGATASVPRLLALLKDADVRVRLAAADAVRRLGAAGENVQAALKAMREDLARRNISRREPERGTEGGEDDFLVGGPLAGVPLPLFPTQHGEPPGHPGCIPALTEKAIKENPDREYGPLNTPFTPCGQSPQRQLYPGSVEHWRAYWFKYCPVRSLFDKQSQVKNWVAPDLPGADPTQVEQYAAPIYWVPRWGAHRRTGYKEKPVPVVRMKVGAPVLSLDCGTLTPGAYVVRLVAAVPTEQMKYFRRDLFIRMRVNDGPRGETTTYVRRAGYTDAFYSMCELFFNVPATRRISVQIEVAEGSRVDLLVHNVSLDDCLAGVERRAVKTGTRFHKNIVRLEAIRQKRPDPRRRRPDLLAEERDLRDRWLWESFPPPNAQGNRPYRFPRTVREGTDKLDKREVARQYGTWRAVMKLGLAYTLDDLRNHRPLPDPYPFKDNGTALTFPDPNDPTKGAWLAPIADVIRDFYWHYPTSFHASVLQWERTGDESYARDAALALARWAYAFPLLVSQEAYLDNLIAEYGHVGRAGRFQRRSTTCRFYRWYTQYAMEELDDYDLLYPFIENNWELAASVGRYVPWVRTPRDVIKLIDTHLVQHTAKRVLRYQWFTGEMKIARLAAVLGDNRLTDPWMQWLFSRTFVYPLPPSGIQDLMITGCTREGTEYIASTSYAGGENALPKAAALLDYIRAGGNPKYDLSDPNRYPKPSATCYWLLERLIGGLNDIRIGDVCGPDKFYGRMFSGLDQASYWGWKWTKDPRFAYLRKHYFGRKDFSDAEWAVILKAAEQVKRPPWLDLPSRALPQWAAILESGRQHDDYRFRRALMIRTGMGWGHHHNDGLDLQVYMHGVMMTCDGGQRPSYSRPGDRSTRMHNLVEVDGLSGRGGEWLGHSWTRTLSDAEGAKYVLCEATAPRNHPNVKLYQRQTALLDVDEGKGSRPLSPDACRPGARLPADVVTPNAYIFDVFRVAGGKRHTYAFHANLSETVTHNLVNPVPIEKASQKDRDYVSRMAGERLAGDAPEHLQIDWRIKPGQVQADLRPNRPEPGPYVTRLHVLGQRGARVLRGSLNCTQWGYQIPMAFVQRRGPDEDKPDAPGELESAFAAIIEPYVGEPFIENLDLLDVADNETDAQRAVAVAVRTKNDHADLCFADGRPDKVRRVRSQAGDVRIAAEFAYLSRDADGLRQASLTGGTLLRTPEVTLKPAAREYTGKVARVDYWKKTLWLDTVDYWKKTLWLDTPWPALSGRPTIFEIGVGNHWTVYTALEVRPEARGARVRLQRGADFYLARVKEIDPKTNTVYCNLGFGTGPGGGDTPAPGIDRHWVASNEEATKFWRAEYLGGDRSTNRFGFRLTGPPAKMADFGRTRGFRLWEYGVGDTARHSTYASLRRVRAGVFRIEADVDVLVGLKGKALDFSADGTTWKPLAVRQVGDRVEVAVPLDRLRPAGYGFLRVR